MYDIIGDIHGYAEPLETLLEKLGYLLIDGVWQHADYQAIFVGDIVDRGPHQQRSIDIVRAMVEAGSAQAVMGNHEFNAVTWTLPDPKNTDDFLRPHNDKNHRQHRVFLKELGEGSQQHQEALDWFKTLPLWLDLDGVRIVHACWHEDSIALLRPYLDGQNRLRENAWNVLGKKGTPEFDALEVLLKGYELTLPNSIQFADKDGHMRSQIRTRWWDLNATTYRQIARVPSEHIETMPNTPAPTEKLPRYSGDKALFVGHYWLNGTPEPLSDSVACVDYSVAAAKGDRKMCAYRWQGEVRLKPEHFVWIEPASD